MLADVVTDCFPVVADSVAALAASRTPPGANLSRRLRLSQLPRFRCVSGARRRNLLIVFRGCRLGCGASRIEDPVRC